MKVVIVGSGNVATVLGRLVQQKGHEIIQVISRNAVHAKALASLLHCSSAGYDGVVNRDADLYLIAIKDNALHELNTFFNLGNKLVVHTAGSVSREVLSNISHNYGVLYPLQSLRSDMDTPAEIPLLIDGNSNEALVLIEDFARSISGQVSRAGDEERLKLHVAAVIVCNFTNHLYALAEEFCGKEEVDFKMLLPLLQETANRVASYSPAAIQTGPAIRNDTFTLERHLRLLADHPRLRYLYLKFTESIMNGDKDIK